MNYIKYTLLKSPILGNIVAIVVSSVLVAPVHAVEYLPGVNLGTTGVKGFILNVLCQIAVWMFWILIALSIVYVLVAAYKYLTSSGDSEKVSSAGKTIIYAAVAIVVALIAKGFPLIVITLFPTTGINTSTIICA